MNIKTTITGVISLVLWFTPGVHAQESGDSPREWKSPWVRGVSIVERDEERPGREQISPNAFRYLPNNSPYEHWFDANKDKMPSFEGLVIQDARTEPLEYWDDMGVNGLYLKMADYQITDGWILEIPPGGSIKPQRHMFEAGMYFFGGPGHIIIQQEGRRPQRIDYKYRSLFSVPLNVRYQIFNDSNEPVRIVAVTNFPHMLNTMNSTDFVFNNDYTFRDRYDAEEDYASTDERPRERLAVTNFVLDALNAEVEEHDSRGVGSTQMAWTMSGNTSIKLHVSEMPPAMYKKAHRHSSDAFILLLSGEGYSLTWPEGGYEDRVRVDWHEGTIFVPPIFWYHQHLNPHPTEAARYQVINAPVIVRNLGLRFESQLEEDFPELEEEFSREVEKFRAREATR